SNPTFSISPTRAPAKAHAGFRSRGAEETTARLPNDSVRAIAGRRGRSVTDRGARGAEQWMLPVSLTPIRFALPITALRDGAPSAKAMLLALFPSSAICLRVSIAASVHISTPPLLLAQFDLVKSAASPAFEIDVRSSLHHRPRVSSGCISWLIQ